MCPGQPADEPTAKIVITPDDIHKVVAVPPSLPEGGRRQQLQWWAGGLAVLVVLALVVAGILAWMDRNPRTDPTASAGTTSSQKAEDRNYGSGKETNWKAGNGAEPT